MTATLASGTIKSDYNDVTDYVDVDVDDGDSQLSDFDRRESRAQTALKPQCPFEVLVI